MQKLDFSDIKVLLPQAFKVDLFISEFALLYGFLINFGLTLIVTYVSGFMSLSFMFNGLDLLIIIGF